MKNAALFCFIMIALPGVLFAQAPQSFSYQAVVRDGTGNVVVNQPVSFQMSIYSGSPTGTLMYSETHAVTTNSFGLADMPIGTGTVISGNFASIDWASAPHFLKVEADTTGGISYTDMGTIQLLSVPYALYAAHTGSGGSVLWDVSGDNIFNTNTGYVGVGTNTPPAKMVVQGDSSMADTVPLFEVKDRTGATVFIIYPDSVRIYVGDDGTKTNKGAFAVSGRNTAKTPTHDFFLVRPDSTRVYTGDGGKGFAVENIGASETESYMFLTPDNYFIGHNSGKNNTSGLYNSFLGYQSGFGNITGNDNIFVGYESGFSNLSGTENVFMGNGAGYLNTTGFNNVFIGNWAGYSNDTAAYNVFIGNNAGNANTFGSANVIIGDAAGEKNTLGNSNVFIGDWCAANNTEGEQNIFIGNEAGWNNTMGNNNIFLGTQCGYLNTLGCGNIFIGETAGYNNMGEFNLFVGIESGASNTTGNSNMFIGLTSGYSNTTGEDNLFVGNWAGYSNLTGSENLALGIESGLSMIDGYSNTIIGNFAGHSNTIGSNNLFIGFESGFGNIDGDSNIFIGNKAGYFETGSNLLYIDNSDTDTPLIFGDFDEDKVTINDILNVAPRSSAPLTPSEGDVYINSTDKHIYCFLNGVWKQLDN